MHKMDVDVLITGNGRQLVYEVLLIVIAVFAGNAFHETVNYHMLHTKLGRTVVAKRLNHLSVDRALLVIQV